MGTFSVSCQVGDLAGEQFVEIEALVDTGATYTVLSEETLAKLGIVPEGERRFALADERVVEYSIGYARIRLEEGQTISLVVFGPPDTSPLIGATTLENLSLGVDPVNQKLVPVNALLK